MDEYSSDTGCLYRCSLCRLFHIFSKSKHSIRLFAGSYTRGVIGYQSRFCVLNMKLIWQWKQEETQGLRALRANLNCVIEFRLKMHTSQSGIDLLILLLTRKQITLFPKMNQLTINNQNQRYTFGFLCISTFPHIQSCCIQSQTQINQC